MLFLSLDHPVSPTLLKNSAVATRPDRYSIWDFGHITSIRIQNAADECGYVKLAAAWRCSPEFQGIR
jgi:hypothetical protein